MKIGCVIQGDIRRGTAQVLKELSSKFDVTILSTWVDDKHKAPHGDYSLVLSHKPLEFGLSNRNLQRLSTAKGIQAAKHAGCDYVLKWRTDMLPTRIDLNILLSWANFEIPKGMKSRLVMPAFRNLSVEPDWFSSIPDLFAFGHIDDMSMLWGGLDFDYSLSMNLPNEMLDDLNETSLNFNSMKDLYCSESELYAIYKSRVQKKLGVELNHSVIASKYFRLINYHRLGIYWFGRERGFRSIGQAWEHPWWTESTWHNVNPKIVSCGYAVNGLSANVRRVLSPFMAWIDEYRQSIKWKLNKGRYLD